MPFQSPMGISMISNAVFSGVFVQVAGFQSPMGISMISNIVAQYYGIPATCVSIPNGDKHDFKHAGDGDPFTRCVVSIPNGDKHDFKQRLSPPILEHQPFQSPMGISMISNFGRRDTSPLLTLVSIPNGDKHDFKRGLFTVALGLQASFNPQWG